MTTSQPERADQKPIVYPFYLLSFSPANGSGLYEYDDLLYLVDLPNDEDLSVTPDVAGYFLSHMGHQLEAGLAFSSKEGMLRYMHHEYLRDKKNNYYAELMTTDTGHTRRVQLLEFLNDEKLRVVQVSKTFVQVLERLWESRLIAAVMLIAQELGLTNVQECLRNDFHQFGLDPEASTQYEDSKMRG